MYVVVAGLSMSRKPDKTKYSAGKLSKPIRKNRLCFFKHSEKLIFRSRKIDKCSKRIRKKKKIDFHYSGEVTHSSCWSAAEPIGNQYVRPSAMAVMAQPTSSFTLKINLCLHDEMTQYISDIIVSHNSISPSLTCFVAWCPK